MKVLKLSSFKRVVTNKKLGFYYLSFKDYEIEICFEPCLMGCDIALYDLKYELLQPKTCTNLKYRVIDTETMLDNDLDWLYEKGFAKAIVIANKLYKEHYDEN